MALATSRVAKDVLLPATKRCTQTLCYAPFTITKVRLNHSALSSTSSLYHKASGRSFSSFASSSSEPAEISSKPTSKTATKKDAAPQPTYNYALAAAYTAKDVPYNPIRNVTTYTTPTEPPSPRKGRLPRNLRPASGQDAYFITQRSNSHVSYAFGVADGVGGWADSGVDPADFSHAFCENMAATYSTDKSEIPAKDLMQAGYDQVLSDKTISAGGSTACIAIAKPEGEVEFANLGDSGFMHIRTGAIRHVSEPQVHAFNTPYQLSVIPEYMRRRARAFGGTQLHDMPGDSAVSRHKVRHGDVLVTATDGVWDNLSSSDVLRTVGRIMLTSGAWEDLGRGIQVSSALPELVSVPIAEVSEEAVSKGEFDGKVGGRGRREEGIRGLQGYLAAAIAGEAKVASENEKRDGPFAKEVQKYYPEEMWRGGKVDDICVVVAVVVEDGVGEEVKSKL